MILWSLRTTPNQSTGFTPFFLAYRAEAVLPFDLDHGTPRVKAFDHDRAAEAQQDAVDLLRGSPRDDHHLLRSLSANSPQVPQKKDQGENPRSQRSRTPEDPINKGKHKLSPPWAGPYTIAEVIRPGTYRLEDNNSNVLNNTWNIE